MVPPTPSAEPLPPVRGALAAALITLAGTPDHSSGLGFQLLTIARLTTDRVAAARYASVTALQGREYITVAVSHELIQAVDDAQYADGAGPCLEALGTGVPVGVPDVDTTVQWPGFHATAAEMGLEASVSVPLYAGRGDPIAALNVYSHDRVAMAPLIAGISAVHGHPSMQTAELSDADRLDAGGRELVSGYAEALAIRAAVRFAIELISVEVGCSSDDAYLSLCLQAREAGTDLAAAATKLINRNS
jgi:hypothetical protein